MSGFPPQGFGSSFAPQGNYSPPPGVTDASNVLLDVDPRSYADADNVWDVSRTNPGTWTNEGSCSVTTRNGHRVLYGNGDANAQINSPLFANPHTGTPLTAYVVWEPVNIDGTAEYPLLLTEGSGGSSNPRLIVGRQAIGNFAHVHYNDVGTIALINNVDGTPLPSDRTIYVTAYEIESTTLRSVWVNGSETADTDTTTVVDVDGSGFRYCSLFGYDAGGNLEGYIYRVIVTQEAYSDTLNDYLLSTYAAQDVAWVDETLVQNSTTGSFEDAQTLWIPPNTLTQDGDWLEVEMWCRRVGAGTQYHRIEFDGTGGSGWLLTVAGNESVLEARIVRTSSTTATMYQVNRSSSGTGLLGTTDVTGIDFTDSIQLTSQIYGVTSANNIQSWYFSARSYKTTGTYTIDVNSGFSGRSTEDTSETTLCTLTIPAGTLTSQNPVAVAKIPVYKTGTAGNGTIRVKVGGSTLETITEAAAETYRIEVTVWRTAGGYRVAHSWVESGGTSDLTISAEVATDLDSNDLAITITGQDADAADALTVDAYTASLRQVQCLGSSVEDVVSAGGDEALYSYSASADEKGKGARLNFFGAWDASPAGACRAEFMDTNILGNNAAASVGNHHTMTMFRQASGATYSRGAASRWFTNGAAYGNIAQVATEYGNDWSASTPDSRLEVGTDASVGAGDYTLHLAYVEATPGLQPGNAPNAPVDVAWADATERGNVSTTETDATVYQLPANTLTADGDWLEIDLAIRSNATGSQKTKLLIDGTQVDYPWLSTSGLEGVLEYRVVRTAATTAELYRVYRDSAGTKDLYVASLTSLDFTNAIEIKTTLQGATATDDLTQHYLRVRSHKVASNLTLDVDASGGTSPNDTNENTLCTLTIPAGKLTAQNPVAVGHAAWSFTGTNGLKTLRLKVDGTTSQAYQSTPAYAARFEVYVWKTAGGYRSAHNWVTDGGAAFVKIEDEVATDTDTNDVVITLTGQTADTADSIVVDAYAHVRQLQCLEVDVSDVVADGSAAQIAYTYTGTADENGKGYALSYVGEWAASFNGAGRIRNVTSAENQLNLSGVANAGQTVRQLVPRVTSSASKPVVAYWRGTGGGGALRQTNLSGADWEGAGATSSVDIDLADAGDFTVHLAYVEALP